MNEKQKSVLPQKINEYFNNDVSGKTFAIWGLSFKPNTDDMREAPSRVVMEALWASGAAINAYDPVAMDEARHLYPNHPHLTFASSAAEVVTNADALIIMTEWNEFKSPAWAEIRNALRHPVIFDGRNMYEPALVAENGFVYHSIGRSVASPND